MKAYKDNSIDICSLYYKEVGQIGRASCRERV